MQNLPTDALTEYAGNPRTHPPEQIKALAQSIVDFGFTVPILVDASNVVIAGHGRLRAAKSLGLAEVPTIRLDQLSPEQIRAYRLADNRLSEMSDWDTSALESELAGLADYDMAALGFEDMLAADAADAPADQRTSTLVNDFIMAPMSVLNAATGVWQQRKKAWRAVLDVDYKAMGRPANVLVDNPQRADPSFYSRKAAAERKVGKKLTTAEFVADHYVQPDHFVSMGTSLFDPVLAELMVAWFSPLGGRVIDPFAGGVERGLVAGMKGRQYLGADVRKDQVEANQAAAARMGLAGVDWTHADSAGLDWGEADFALTCPPYWCLERYGGGPGDLSEMSLPDFDRAHSEIIGRCAAALRPNRFAVWVMGDCRDPKTRNWVSLPSRCREAFESHGMVLHAEIIFVTPVGSRWVGVRRNMTGKRTITGRHEVVQVFVKGDPAAAAAEFGPVEVGEAPEEVGDDADE